MEEVYLRFKGGGLTECQKEKIVNPYLMGDKEEAGVPKKDSLDSMELTMVYFRNQRNSSHLLSPQETMDKFREDLWRDAE